MADKDTLWAYVKTVYDDDGLKTLTNIRDRDATAIDDDVGTAAAFSTINLWPIYAQVAFDVDDATHLEVAAFGVIATLWARGGTAQSIQQVSWDHVFGDGGLIEKVRRTGPRAHRAPKSNSSIQTSAENENGVTPYGWSDRKNVPPGILPRSTAPDSVD